MCYVLDFALVCFLNHTEHTSQNLKVVCLVTVVWKPQLSGLEQTRRMSCYMQKSNDSPVSSQTSYTQIGLKTIPSFLNSSVK